MSILNKIRDKNLNDIYDFLSKKFYFFNYSYCEFGKNYIIRKPLLIKGKKYIYIKNNVRIRDNSRIEAISKWGDYKFIPKIIIEEGVSIEQNLHLTCANEVIIGKETTISANVFITDIDHNYNQINKSVLYQGLDVKKTSIGEYSFIGIGVKIMAGVNIGKNCIIGANAVVTTDIPEYSVAVGIPAKVIKKYDFKEKRWKKVSEK